jgi:hypothetical protein
MRTPEMQRFLRRLSALVEPKEVPAWLQTPNKAFDGLKLLEVIERGEMGRLWSMIFFLESGVAS